MYSTVTFTRADLYQKVWNTPILKLAAEIGISDVALAKACRRANIPLPGRGYWAKDVRHRPAQPPLLGDVEDKISFSVMDKALRPSVPVVAHEPITVAEQLTEPHALITATLKAAKGADVTEGRLALKRKRSLNLSVSPKSLDRALRLLDATIKASEAAGHCWKITDEGDTAVTVNAVTMKIVLKERLTKRELPPPPKPPAPPRIHPRGPYFDALLLGSSFRSREFEWVPTGELTILIDEHFRGSARTTWKDTASVPLEDKLASLVAHLPVTASVIKAWSDELAEISRQSERAEIARVRNARIAEEQRLLRAKLVGAMEAWERAERLRRFCGAVEASPECQHESRPAWLVWARGQADRLDPLLSPEFRQMFQLKAQVDGWFKGLSPYEDPKPDWWTMDAE